MDKNIVFHPWARKLRNGSTNPKNYAYWEELLKLVVQKFPEYKLIQVGIEGELQLVPDFRKNLTLKELETLIDECDTFIGIDSFFQHLAWVRKKKGIVLFSQSDPLIFGHKENVNLLKDRKYLREKQMWLWEQTEYTKNAFVGPQVVLDELQKLLKK
jgi:ADP-heptose:LPS heptosyltransferase